MRKKRVAWDAISVKGLRRHMQLTQEQLAEALGVRQQTVSEWETGLHAPRGASGRRLTIVTEQAEFAYEAGDGAQRDETQRSEDSLRSDDVRRATGDRAHR